MPRDPRELKPFEEPPIRIQVTEEHRCVDRSDSTLPRVEDEQVIEDDLEATKMRGGFQESGPLELVPEGARASLRVLQGPARGQVLTLDAPYNTIGRNPDNTIVIRDDFASGRHAAIFFSQQKEWRLEDLGSRNGTLLNGSKVKAFAIRHGDKILIGDHLLQFIVATD